MKKFKKKAFTLVELMVVIAILAVLAAVSIVGYSSFIDREKERGAVTEANQAREIISAEVIKKKDGKISFNFDDPSGTVTFTFDNGELYVETTPGIVHNESSGPNGFDKMLRKTFPNLASLPGFFTIDGSIISYHSDPNNPSENIIVNVVTGEVLKHKDKDASDGSGVPTEGTSQDNRIKVAFNQSVLRMAPGSEFTVNYEVLPSGTEYKITKSGENIDCIGSNGKLKISAISDGTAYVYLTAGSGDSKAEAKLTVIVDKDSKTPVALPTQKNTITYDGNLHGDDVQWNIPTGAKLVSVEKGTEPSGTGSPAFHYLATFALEGDQYRWAVDGSSGTKTVEWILNKKSIRKPYQINKPTFLDGRTLVIGAALHDKNPEWDNGEWRTLYNNKQIEIEGQTGRAKPGTYTTTFEITEEGFNHYCWEGQEKDRFASVQWKIYKEKIEIPKVTNALRQENGVYIFEYTGRTITPNVDLPANGTVVKRKEGSSATECGTYTISLYLDLSGYGKDYDDCFEWADGTYTDKVIKWSIVPRTFATPQLKSPIAYTGREQTASWKEDYSKYPVTISGNKGTDAGEYTATFTLTDTKNFKWANSTSDTISVKWNIDKAVVNAPKNNEVYNYSRNKEYGPATSSDYGSKYTLVSGTGKASKLGTYTSTLKLTSTKNYKWSDSEEQQITINWSIKSVIDLPKVVSYDSTTYTYDGKGHYPIWNVEGNDLVSITGDNSKKIDIDTYTTKFKLVDTINSAWSDGSTTEKTINWYITKAKVSKPKVKSYDKTTYKYDGDRHGPEWDYDSDYVTVSDPNNKTANAGNYKAVFSLKSTKNSEWSDGTTDPITIDWNITKVAPSLSVKDIEFDSNYSKTVEVNTKSDGAITVSSGNEYFDVSCNSSKKEITVTAKNISTTKRELTITVTLAEGTNYEAKQTTFKVESKKSSGGGGCVTADTLITMADGTQKQIKDVEAGESIVAFDHEKGQYVNVPALAVFNHGYDQYDVLKLNFEDGTEFKLVIGHSLFDLDLQKYVEIYPNNYENYIGHRFVKYIGEEKTIASTTLESVTVTREYTECWGAFGTSSLSIVTNGMLSVPNCPGIYNYFDYGTDLKYDEASMKEDIENYGLYTYDDWKDITSEYVYDGFNFKYFNIAIEKGIATKDTYIGYVELFNYLSSIN